jgi:The GLUG motif
LFFPVNLSPFCPLARRIQAIKRREGPCNLPLRQPSLLPVERGGTALQLRTLILVCTAAALCASTAGAKLSISTRPTKNVTCSAGVCTATATRAVLNAGDLIALLDSGDVTVKSGPKAQDIETVSALSWTSAHKLTLDSYRGITVDRHIDVAGGSGMTLTTNDGGTGGLFFVAPRASIDFGDTSDSLEINGASYQLASDLGTLAFDISGNQTGHFALANDYDATPDGVYQSDPLPQFFLGTFEGLGHRIMHLHIDTRVLGGGLHVGLFYGVGGGPITNLHLDDIDVRAGPTSGIGGLAGLCFAPVFNVEVTGRVNAGAGSQIGGLCGIAEALISSSHSSGTVAGTGNSGDGRAVGGLIGVNDGTIKNSFSSAKVTSANGWMTGGLVGSNASTISTSFATGTVLAGKNGIAGSLVGSSAGTNASVRNSYAMGAAFGDVGSTVGGLIGLNNAPVSDAYSSGRVASGSGNAVGGLIGNDLGASDLTDTYWDIDTSGQSHGVGSNTGYPGVTSLTTAQFQAGLPSGFDPSVWAEDSAINNGLPYLLSNPQ